MLRNPEDMPSACYLPSHPPGKLPGRQAHCAELPPRRWAAGCPGPWQGHPGPGCSRGVCPRHSRGPRASALNPPRAAAAPRPRRGSEDRAVLQGGLPCAGPMGAVGATGAAEAGCGRWVTGRPGTKDEEAGRRCRYWALTQGSLREGLSFGQHAGSKCARKVTETTECVI